MKKVDVAILESFAANQVSLLLIKDPKNPQLSIQTNWLSRLIIWICNKLGCPHRAKLDKIIPYIIAQMKEIGNPAQPSTKAITKLIKKIEHYNLKHKVKIDSSFLKNWLNPSNTIIKQPYQSPNGSPISPSPIKQQALMTNAMSCPTPQSKQSACPALNASPTETLPIYVTDPYKDLPSVFKEIGADVEAADIPEYKKVRARFMVQDLGLIEVNLPVFKQLDSDSKRAREINRQSTEKYDRSAGEEEAPSYKSLIARNQLFIETYQKAKNLGKLVDFFSVFMHGGGPCLTGRTEMLQAFAASLESAPSHIIPEDTANLLTLPSNLWCERIMTQIDEGSWKLNDITPDLLKNYLHANIAEVIEEFSQKETDSPLVVKFLEFLQHEGLYSKGEAVDWNALMPAVLNSTSFGIIYSHVMLFYKETVASLDF